MIPVLFQPRGGGGGGGGGAPATVIKWDADEFLWGAGNYLTWG